ncbi:MAG: Sec-independent protein translocase protein TatB [Deltaproteobacteria bacterium]|nr:Sec-independent protein translocase protein TatB [Deltaproteobacteria bacterium]
MFNLGMPEIILILVVALIILGPKKLPEMAKSLGKGLREFRKAADDLKDGIEKDLRDEIKKPAQPNLSQPNVMKPEPPPPAGAAEQAEAGTPGDKAEAPKP